MSKVGMVLCNQQLAKSGCCIHNHRVLGIEVYCHIIGPPFSTQKPFVVNNNVILINRELLGIGRSRLKQEISQLNDSRGAQRMMMVSAC